MFDCIQYFEYFSFDHLTDFFDSMNTSQDILNWCYISHYMSALVASSNITLLITNTTSVRFPSLGKWYILVFIYFSFSVNLFLFFFYFYFIFCGIYRGQE